MRYVFSRSFYHSLAVFLLFIGAWANSLHAAETKILNVREGLHKGYSRIVLDCVGQRPTSMRLEPSGVFSVAYEGLVETPDLERVSGRFQGAVKHIRHQGKPANRITLSFKEGNVRVKPFILRTGERTAQTYRVVLDIYSQSGKSSAPAATAPAAVPATAAATAAAVIPKAPVIAASPPVAESTVPAEAEPGAEEDETREVAQAETTDSPVETDAGDPENDEDDQTPGLVYTGEASVMLRSVDGEDESAEFEKYRDISQAVSGDLSIDAVWDQRYYIKGRAQGVGQEDLFAGIDAGKYGIFDLAFSYDQFIRRYAFDVKTLYSGVGSDRMLLDDSLQANLQAAPSPVEEALRLNGFLSSAATGNPDVSRDRVKLDAGLVAADPFNFKLEVTHEKRQGTRPFAGAFSSSQMVELFEPIDQETIGMKISAEYAKAPYYVNLAYHYSQFSNNNDTLTFDNPLSNDDTVAPSRGSIDLAPDNQYHNLSFTGVLTKLPGNSQLTANAALGMMMQDDDLAPFTTNTDPALAVPILPTDSADAKVNTQLYHLRLTSKPLPFLRVKGRLRYYDYDNQTDPIDFSGGYVETDTFVDTTSLTTLPTSYTKTLAGLDLGFDVFTRTTLGIGYQFERTERENREVEEQDDQIVKVSADTRAVDWLDLRVSYERTNREIGDYDFDVYTKSGDDLEQLPQLRKYDQADMVRDRIQLQATVYPIEKLAIGGSFIYGRDDYSESPFGLQEDNHFIVSADADYAINEQMSVNLFYTRETYDNTQKGRQDSISTFDWTAEGEDVVSTFGGGLTAALLPDKLDFDLAYTYSEVDGSLSLSSPSGAFSDFTAVDDTTLHVLNAKLTYHFNPRLSLAVGYLWESFDYEDYAAEGFSNVPTDASGNYQGALLSGTLPEDYDASIIYTRLTFRLP